MSNEPTPDSHAGPLGPTFLDEDLSPVPVLRTAMRYHLDEPCDMNAWATTDVGIATIAGDASLPGGHRGPGNRG